MTEAQLLLLQRWSLGAQAGTLALLASFFLLLARTQPLAEVRLWAVAWVANAAALGAYFAATMIDDGAALSRLLLGLFAAGKTAFVALLLAGTRYHVQPGVGIAVPTRPLALLLVGWGGSLALFVPAADQVRLAQAVMVAAILGAAAFTVLGRPRTPRSRWLGAAMLVDALLFSHYVPLLAPTLWGAPPFDPGHLFLSALFETGAEALVALASLVALQGTITASLQHLNQELEESQARLRHLVDVDPLTGLFNRRALRPFLESARTAGAAIIVLDVDDFKQVNDTHGHIVGDECLKRVAETMRTCFRAEDGLFRWGGDEFLLVCPGLDLDTAWSRTAELTRALTTGDHRLPVLHVSAGIVHLPPGGEPDAALHDADALMLATKPSRQTRER